ncbi:MAG: hypothetical protein MJ192_02150 [Clostridia bacterium]|nr:hypothetical protein [Clostridia bacterium]
MSAKKEKVIKQPKPKKVKKTRAQKKAEKKAEKEAILPIHKRPIICPPDKAGRHPAFRIAGYVCRALVIWIAVAGITMFVSNAMDYGVTNGFIFGFSALVVGLCALAAHGKIEAIAASVITAGLAAWKIATNPKIVTDLFYGVLALYNGCLERLYRIGYLSYVKYEAAINSSTSVEELLKIGVGILIVLFGTIFTFCLIRKVRLVPPAITATTFLVVILTFNIYSNRMPNLGIVLVIISFAAILVMSAYDRQYRIKDTKKYDTELSLFGDSDRPKLPEAYEKQEAEKAARKQAKKDKKSREKQGVVTVDEELTDYFAEKPKKSKTEKKKLTPAEQAKRKAEEKELKKQVRAVETYDRVTEQSRSAMGGFMSAAALLVAGLAILLPAILVSGNFSTIEAIDEKMAYARDYVTAVLRGDDTTLDELEYQADGEKFKSHSTELQQLHFDGTQIFHVTARYNTNYYMTGWAATDYDAAAGSWSAVSDAQLDKYRSLFGLQDSPAEEMRYNLFHYLRPSAVDDPDYTENKTSKYKANLNYGFVNTLVSTRRINSPGSECYLPVSYGHPFELYEYMTQEPSKLTLVNYFDGIRTGRKFKDNKAAYASYTYAPIMTQSDWAANTAWLTDAWEAAKEAVLICSSIPADVVDADTANNSPLLLATYDEPDGTTIFTYTLQSRKEQQSWSFYHLTKNVKKNGSTYVIKTDAGTLTVQTARSGRVYGVMLDGYATLESENLLSRWHNSMTDEDREALLVALTLDMDYTDFVYSTYMQKSGNARIAELAKEIAAQAHTEGMRTVTKHWEDDPETEEDEYEEYTEEEIYNIPADVSLAGKRSLSTASAFTQRDILVRNVIDYLIDEMGCKYTITPDLSTVDPSVDGVENFLFNTHEGYCVQFASAAALILREYGIPVRYVEGYIASGLTKNSGTSDFIYSGYVHDYEAHAWIEVFFDGLGWVQYETTPQYYTGMYGAKSTGNVPSKPIIPIETDTEQETKPADDPILHDETDTETDTGEVIDDGVDPAVLRTVGITLLIIVGLAVIGVVIATVVNKAREAEAHRQSNAFLVLESGYGEHTSEGDRRELALEMADDVTDLLALYGLSPKPGEFRDEYADRLTATLTATAGESKSRANDGITLPDLHAVMDALAAEEFGYGMNVGEMKDIGMLYLYLHRDVKKYIPAGSRFTLRYFKRKI